MQKELKMCIMDVLILAAGIIFSSSWEWGTPRTPMSLPRGKGLSLPWKRALFPVGIEFPVRIKHGGVFS